MLIYRMVHDTLELPTMVSLLRSSFTLADAAHLKGLYEEPYNPCLALPPSPTPTMIKAVCFTVLHSLPSKAGASQHPLLTNVLCVRRNWAISKE